MRVSDDRAALHRQIHDTLLHELGHMFGMSETDLDHFTIRNNRGPAPSRCTRRRSPASLPTAGAARPRPAARSQAAAGTQPARRPPSITYTAMLCVMLWPRLHPDAVRAPHRRQLCRRSHQPPPVPVPAPLAGRHRHRMPRVGGIDADDDQPHRPPAQAPLHHAQLMALDRAQRRALGVQERQQQRFSAQ